MDFNAHSAQQLNRQRSEQLARVIELRRRSAERASLIDATVEPVEPAPAGRWHRILIRWHLAPRLAH